MDNPTERDQATDKARDYLISSRILEERAAQVGEIAAAEAEQARLQADLTANEKRLEAAYTAALKGGWTPEDLHALGYRPPARTKGRRGGRRTTRRTTTDTAPTPPSDDIPTITPATETHPDNIAATP